MEEKKLKEVEIPEISTSAENLLTIVAGFILALGIIATVILACTTLQTEVYNGYYNEDVFNPMGFAITLGTLLSTLATWAVLRVIANISLRLKAIQETMPRRLMTEKEFQQTVIEEKQTEKKKVHSDFTVGETILYKGSKYQIENISGSTGRICIYRGAFAGYAWLYPEEVSKVEEKGQE